MSNDLYRSVLYEQQGWNTLDRVVKKYKRIIHKLETSKTYEGAKRILDGSPFRDVRALSKKEIEEIGKVRPFHPLSTPNPFTGIIIYQLGIEESTGENWFSVLNQPTPNIGRFNRGYTQFILSPEISTIPVDPRIYVCRAVSVPAEEYFTGKISNGWIYTGDKV